MVDTRFAKVTDCRKLYKAATPFTEVKTDTPKHNKAAKRFAGVKTDCSKYYKPPTRLAEAQTYSPKSTRLQHPLRKPKWTLQGCYKLCGSQNGLYEALQGFYVL